MAKFTPEAMKKRLEEAKAERVEAEKKSAPARKAWQDFVDKTLQPAEAKAKALAEDMKKAERPLVELDMEIAALSRALGSRSIAAGPAEPPKAKS